MDNLATSLSPAFAAGFAVQRILELFDGILSKAKNKKVVCNIISLVTGLALAQFGNLHVLASLSGSGNISLWIDVPVTGLIVSGGTEGLNSIMKFLNYTKEEKKTDTADKQAAQTPASKAVAATI